MLLVNIVYYLINIVHYDSTRGRIQMAYVLIRRVTRPSNVAWYSAANTTVTTSTVSSLATFVAAQPGLQHNAQHTRDGGLQSDAMYVFDTKANGVAFKAALLADASYQTIEAYNNANGITTIWHQIQ